MYKLIGADQREYGPASVETVRRWIAEGRANAQTIAQAEGSSEWKPLAAFPELAAMLGLAPASSASAPPPPPPPSSEPVAADAPSPWSSSAPTAGEGAGPAAATAALAAAASAPRVDPDALAAELCARDFQLDIEGCVSRSWGLLTKNFWLVVGAYAVTTVVQIAIGSIPYLGFAAGLLLGGVFAGGLYWFLLRLARGERVSIGDVFAGFSLALGPLILFGLVSSVLTGVGLLLCLLPGIYLAVAWSLASLLVIDKKLEFWAAMELSRKVITRHWWGMLGLILVCFLIYFGGLLACCIGVLVTGPLAHGALVQAYLQLFEKPEATPA